MEQVPVIGIDLAVTAASELAVAAGATIEASRKVASTPRGLTEGIRQAAKGRAVAIVVESTAMAWFIAAVAAVRSGVEYRLYRVSGRKSAALRAFYRSHTKTDHIDARVLARMPAVDDSLLIYTLPAPSELAMKRLVVARHKLTTETTKLQNRVRSLLAWAAPGIMKAAGGTVSAGLVRVLGRWSDLTSLAKTRVATIALQGDWGTERAEAVRTAAAEAVAFYEGHVDFSAVSLELELSLAQLGFLASQIKRLVERIASLHAELSQGPPPLHPRHRPGRGRGGPGHGGVTGSTRCHGRLRRCEPRCRPPTDGSRPRRRSSQTASRRASSRATRASRLQSSASSLGSVTSPPPHSRLVQWRGPHRFGAPRLRPSLATRGRASRSLVCHQPHAPFGPVEQGGPTSR